MTNMKCSQLVLFFGVLMAAQLTYAACDSIATAGDGTRVRKVSDILPNGVTGFAGAARGGVYGDDVVYEGGSCPEGSVCLEKMYRTNRVVSGAFVAINKATGVATYKPLNIKANRLGAPFLNRQRLLTYCESLRAAERSFLEQSNRETRVRMGWQPAITEAAINLRADLEYNKCAGNPVPQYFPVGSYNETNAPTIFAVNDVQQLGGEADTYYRQQNGVVTQALNDPTLTNAQGVATQGPSLIPSTAVSLRNLVNIASQVRRGLNCPATPSTVNSRLQAALLNTTFPASCNMRYERSPSDNTYSFNTNPPLNSNTDAYCAEEVTCTHPSFSISTNNYRSNCRTKLTGVGVEEFTCTGFLPEERVTFVVNNNSVRSVSTTSQRYGSYNSNSGGYARPTPIPRTCQVGEVSETQDGVPAPAPLNPGAPGGGTGSEVPVNR